MQTEVQQVRLARFKSMWIRLCYLMRTIATGPFIIIMDLFRLRPTVLMQENRSTREPIDSTNGLMIERVWKYAASNTPHDL